MKDLYTGESELESGTGGGGGNTNKKMRKMDFRKPMENFTSSLETLNNALEDEDFALASKTLHKYVTDKYTNISALVGFESRTNYSCREASDEEEEEVE